MNVSLHRTAIADALRAPWAEDHRDEKPLGAYAQARSLTALEPDPAWPDEHLVLEDAVMLARVEAWLAEHGAALGAGDDGPLPPVDVLRERNRAVVLDVCRRANALAAAWERRERRPPSGLPGEPVEVADAAGTAAILDFDTRVRR